jgi:transposase-like protein
MGRIFTHEQKLQYLKDGYVFVRSGKGFYKTYIATKIGVSRTTYYRWMQKHADEAGIQIRGRRKSSNRSLVPIGKPKRQSPAVSSPLSVEFFEARINVSTEEDPVTVLKAVKQASAI